MANAAAHLVGCATVQCRLSPYSLRLLDALPQANVDPATPSAEWPLEALAGKVKQYCSLLDDLTADSLAAEAGGDYEALRQYLRRRGIQAYYQKVEMVEGVEKGLMQVGTAVSVRDKLYCVLLCVPRVAHRA